MPPTLGAVALVGLIVGVIAQAPAPLPEHEAFLAAVRDRLATDPRLQEGYSYKVRVTEFSLNPFGRMGTGAIEVYEVYPLPEDMTYRRLVERAGALVPPAELAAQDQKFVTRYEAWRQRRARETPRERAARLKRLAEAAARERAEANEAMDVLAYTLERRDTIEGEPAIVVRFDPRPHVRPRSREARLASAFAGHAWIHEREHEVMRLEARAIEDAAFGFGILARLHEGATAHFSRRPVHGVWRPAETRFAGTGRALLVRKVTFDYRREYFDYQPFDPSDLPARLGASATRNR